MTKERMFPILLSSEEKRKFPDCPKEIPWNLIAPHENQARKNHFQSLERLAERGGLSPEELWCVFKDHDYVPGIKTEDAIMWLHGFICLKLGILP